MKKSIVFKLALVAFALVFSVNASAGIIDGLLKPLLEQFNVTETTVQWSNVPVYSAQKVVETDADGKKLIKAMQEAKAMHYDFVEVTVL